MPIDRGKYYAHIKKENDKLKTQTVDEHCNEVAKLAKLFLDKFGLGDIGYHSGMYHDLGKYLGSFQRRIRIANGIINGKQISVNHSSPGAILTKNNPYVSIPICFHHGGLKNISEYFERIKDIGLCKINKKLYSAPSIPATNNIKQNELSIRMVYSALCDADFIDTEKFFDSNKNSLRGSNSCLIELKDKLFKFIDSFKSSANNSLLNRVRNDIQNACLSSASQKNGFFSLSVPTGGGKTISSMVFAVEHALSNGMDRVISIMPYTSIIEQNAKVYKNIFGNNNVLEHHSSFQSDLKNKLNSENWDAPIVVSTTVQLFESIFSNKSSRNRKLHNIANSVIILDEAQKIPENYLGPIIDVLNELVESFNCSVVFCSATQPSSNYNWWPKDITQIVPKNITKNNVFDRVDFVFDLNQTDINNLSKDIAAENNILAVVNLRKTAKKLSSLVENMVNDDSVIHLSALMCAEHRSLMIKKIRDRLENKIPTRVISTRLIEAGVDLDFDKVFCMMSGLDSIVQAGGRCNREGKKAKGIVRVFDIKEDDPGQLKTLKIGKETVENMIRNGSFDPKQDSTVDNYFKMYYSKNNIDSKDIRTKRKKFEFESVSNSFNIVEDDWSEQVVIPYDDRCKRSICEIESRISKDLPFRDQIRILYRYMVSVNKKIIESELQSGVVKDVGKIYILNNMSYYNEKNGLEL